jgi:hypothetical protein
MSRFTLSSKSTSIQTDKMGLWQSNLTQAQNTACLKSNESSDGRKKEMLSRRRSLRSTAETWSE